MCIEKMSESKPSDDASLLLKALSKLRRTIGFRTKSGRYLLTDPMAAGV